MRRLVAFAAAVLLVETMFFAALAPLLPRFADDLDLSKWESGLLVSMYALAAGVFAIPSGMIASRVGVRTTAAAGLALLAATSVLFGLVHGYWPLVLTRFGQGMAGTLCWNGALAWLIAATPRERRGQMIGSAMSAAIGGALIGPILGAFASHFGRLPAFSAVAVVALLLTGLTATLPAPPPAARQRARVLLDAVRRRDVQVGIWLLLLPALLFGTLSVLGPLQLDRLGWGVVGIAGTFVAAAIAEAALSPLIGRWSDRGGRHAPVRLGLVGAILVCLTIPWIADRWLLSAAIVLAGITWGMFWTPSMAMVSDGWEAAGVEHGLGFSLLSLGFAPGNVIGSAAGGAVASATSDQAAWGILAVLSAVTLVTMLMVRRGRVRTAPS